eukprot:2413172-Alexandrium_andersonii.AAC.1
MRARGGTGSGPPTAATTTRTAARRSPSSCSSTGSARGLASPPGWRPTRRTWPTGSCGSVASRAAGSKSWSIGPPSASASARSARG